MRVTLTSPFSTFSNVLFKESAAPGDTIIERAWDCGDTGNPRNALGVSLNPANFGMPVNASEGVMSPNVKSFARVVVEYELSVNS